MFLANTLNFWSVRDGKQKITKDLDEKVLKKKFDHANGYQGRFEKVCINSLLQLTPLIYAEKFEFENPGIMEDKQCKQTERFSVMNKEQIIFCC